MQQSAAKVDQIYLERKQDVVRLEAAAGGGNGGSWSPSWARGVAIVQVDINWFRCPVCSRILLPPVFQCKRGHLACGRCRAGKCPTCKKDGGGSGSFDSRNTVAEDIISVSKFKCPHSGCHEFFPYPKLHAHSGECRHAPCFCPETGCTFAAPPTILLAHLVDDHSRHVHSVTYGKIHGFSVPLSEPRRLLLAEEDNRVFAVVLGALGAVTAVSMVCVRAPGGGASQPRYIAELRARRPPGVAVAMGSTVTTAMEMVTSSDRPGEVGVEKLPWVLAVPSTCLLAGDDGVPKEVALKICIKKISGDLVL
uniref:Uncharacterized protein n=1 Tax=Avena sativa TaxID=4498 RepID=A0ACD5TQU7_AVESA